MRARICAASLGVLLSFAACGGSSTQPDTGSAKAPALPAVSVPCDIVGTLPCQIPPAPQPAPKPAGPSSFAVSGGVTDGFSHGVLPNITITLSTGAKTITDAKGRYAFADVPKGDGQLTAAATGYVTQAQSFSLSADASIDIVLQRVGGSTSSPSPSPSPTPSPSPNPTPTPSPSSTALSVILNSPGTLTAGTGATLRFSMTPIGAIVSTADWTFGDGTTASGTTQSMAHTFTSAGTYTVSVAVKDTQSRTATSQISVTVNAAQAAPGASYSMFVSASPAAILTGGSSLLTATVTANNGAPSPTSYTWDCAGDGSANVTNASSTHTCVYAVGGHFVYSRVTATGGSVSATIQAPVAVSVFPVITVSCTANVHLGSASTCSITATVDGSAVTSASITSVDWNFGDGTTVTVANSNVSPAHTYASSGAKTVTATATVNTTSGTGTGSVSTTIQP